MDFRYEHFRQAKARGHKPTLVYSTIYKCARCGTQVDLADPLVEGKGLLVKCNPNTIENAP